MSICEAIKTVVPGDSAARFVAGVFDKRTGEIIPSNVIFYVDLIAGEAGVYVLDEEGKNIVIFGESGEPISVEKKILRGDFAILWKEDAP